MAGLQHPSPLEGVFGQAHFAELRRRVVTPYFVCPNGNPHADCLHFPNLPFRAQMLFSRLFKTPAAPAKVQEAEQAGTIVHGESLFK